jgi:hypothetical protein
MPANVRAEFVGPTPAQLSETSTKDFEESMRGIAEMGNLLRGQKAAAEAAKLKAQQEQDAADAKQSWDVINAMKEATITKSYQEVASNPAGQQALLNHFKTLKMSDEQAKSVVGFMASSPYSADQLMDQMSAKALAGVGAGAGASTGSSSQSSPPAKTASFPEPMPVYPSLSPDVVNNQGANAPAPPMGPNQVPGAPATAPQEPLPPAQGALSPQQARQQQVAGAQAKSAAVGDLRQEVRSMDPASAQAFVREALAPGSLYLSVKAMQKDPNKFMEDTDPRTIAKLDADIKSTLATARNVGAEADKAVIDLQTWAEKNKASINLDKARTLLDLRMAANADVNAKTASVFYQMNNAVLNDHIKNAQSFASQANAAYEAKLKGGQGFTGQDLANLNSLVSQANSSYDAANQIALTMQLSLGGKKENVPQFQHVDFYQKDPKGNGLIGGVKAGVQTFLGGEGSANVPVIRGGGGAEGTPAPTSTGAGIGVPQARGSSAANKAAVSTSPSFTPEEQDLAKQILDSMK